MATPRHPDNAITRVAAKQHGVVTHALARASGATQAIIDHRTRTGRWTHLGRGTYAIAGSVETWHRRLAALQLATDGIVSHLAAAVLHRLRYLPDEIPPEVTVGITRSARSPLGTVHRSRDLALATTRHVDGFLVTDVARTLLYIAALIGPARYRRIVDDALDRKLVTLGDLDACLTRHRRRGRRGIRRLDAAMAERGDGTWVTESVFERRFLEFCDRFGIPRPSTQVTLRSRDRVFARADCVFHDAGLIVELDGRRGHLQLVNRETDLERDQIAVGEGWRVMRVTWLQFTKRPGALAARLCAALDLGDAHR